MNHSRRITEADLLLPTLRLLNEHPNGKMTTSELIVALMEEIQPEGEDIEILDGRQDTRFSQIVRNLVSHKKVPGNIIAEGYAEHVGPRQGIRITEAGKARLASRRS
jgi:hypothetical protein